MWRSRKFSLGHDKYLLAGRFCSGAEARPMDIAGAVEHNKHRKQFLWRFRKTRLDVDQENHPSIRIRRSRSAGREQT